MSEEDIKELLSARVEALHNEVEALRILKEHDLISIDRRFIDHKEALSLALESLDHRFEAIRQEITPLIEKLENRANILEQTDANLSGRMWAFGAILTFLNLAMGWWFNFGSKFLVHP